MPVWEGKYLKSENNFFSVGEKTRTKEKKEIFGEENIFLEWDGKGAKYV